MMAATFVVAVPEGLAGGGGTMLRANALSEVVWPEYAPVVAVGFGLFVLVGAFLVYSLSSLVEFRRRQSNPPAVMGLRKTPPDWPSGRSGQATSSSAHANRPAKAAGQEEPAAPPAPQEPSRLPASLPASAQPTVAPVPSAGAREGGARWIPADGTVTVGGRTLGRGFVYVGETLAPQNGWGQQDNCLVVPSLPTASPPDTDGESLDYWPSYERLTPTARRAYLDWLASSRDNPETPIGYVFLYFYGLERRLMLDSAADDRASVAAEVERLLSAYGSNRSFRRHAAELLGAATLPAAAAVSMHTTPAIGLADVPIRVKLELGRNAVEGKPISALLLLELAANHPETRLRAPIRRLPELAAQRFVAQVGREHPQGVRIALPEGIESVPFLYKAASGTFTAPILPPGWAMPDVTQLPEPLGYGRRLLDEIATELDAYSREVARDAGASLFALTRLPSDLRRSHAAKVAAQALARLDAVAASGKMFRLADLLELVGLKQASSTKMGLRDLSRCLLDWGLGIAPDPHFVPRIIEAQDGVLVFRLPEGEPAAAGPSEHYRLIYLNLALGLVVAKADGTLSAEERRHLYRLVVLAPEISAGERRRLVADFLWLEANPVAVSDLRRHLRDASPEARQALMSRLVPIAAADGRADASEVASLEKLAKTLGLAPGAVYEKLHQEGVRPGDEPPMIESPSGALGQTIPPAPLPDFDARRLEQVRTSSARSAALLDDIFAEDKPAPPQPTPAAPPSRKGPDLDQRHRTLLDELLARPSWSKADFERLVRDSGLMPAGVVGRLNDWSIELSDEPVLEGDDPIVVNRSSILESV